MTIHDFGYAVGYLTGTAVVISVPVICLWIVLSIVAKVLKKVQVSEIQIPAPVSAPAKAIGARNNKTGRKTTRTQARPENVKGIDKWALWTGKDGRRLFIARKNGHVMAEIQGMKLDLPEELKSRAVSNNGKLVLHLPADPKAKEWKDLFAALDKARTPVAIKRSWRARAGTWSGNKKASIEELTAWLSN